MLLWTTGANISPSFVNRSPAVHAPVTIEQRKAPREYDAELSMRYEARRIAANIAKLPELYSIFVLVQHRPHVAPIQVVHLLQKLLRLPHR